MLDARKRTFSLQCYSGHFEAESGMKISIFDAYYSELRTSV